MEDQAPLDETRDQSLSYPCLDDEVTQGMLPEAIARYRIERVLGKGGFGLVYLAYDEQLNRHVAIKVPHSKLINDASDAEAYLTEARTVANLDHPHIVPVYDVGCTDVFPCYIVSKFVEGTNLSTRLKQQNLSPTQSAELVAIIADALHYAHKKGLVHRDVKPGNILLDNAAKPYVVDFGLALREENIGMGPRLAGTPVYMSPEQARGEGHRVDGRSDIFSLGIVLYQMLVGRRPFKAETQQELVKQITAMEARPPRQIDDAVPKELERICMKAMSKRASDRYTTARDFADDLRHFLEVNPSSFAPTVSTVSELVPTASAESTAIGPESETSKIASQSQIIRIVPKGLRSFDAHDADFFLELLPGPRDRHGLPDSLRFWKTRIEESDADETFAVGLIYGPSGCGKSSLVKAGLLPRLSPDVISVYIESTPDETESRLLHGLRKRCPGLNVNLGLKETLTALRRGNGIPPGRKVLIVLDQFEQWLHAKKDEENTELVQALRQCDGGRLQCVVMVRDDFWLAVSRFLRDLEIRLVEGENSALTDLFDLDHARRVLAAFGQAFGKYPETEKESRFAKNEFLKQSVAGLAEEGKVICVRLALFAEMMKGKPWTASELKAVGGTTGIGVTFLEETFGSSKANPGNRYHQKAARAVLSALLPDAGTDIKGEMKSCDELIEVSGYQSRSKDFDDLLHVMDNETRLITPTDPEGVSAEDEASVSHTQSGQKYYQLAHDYLVPSLRDWLTRKQKETRQGRAEFKLAERSSQWNANPENRRLPSLGEHLSIRLLTNKWKWTPAQKKMMSRSGSVHGLRTGLIAILLIAVLGGGLRNRSNQIKANNERIAKNNDQRVSSLVSQLLRSENRQVLSSIEDMTDDRRLIDPKLKSEMKKHDPNSSEYLRLSLAILPSDSSQVGYLTERLFSATPEESESIRTMLKPHYKSIIAQVWEATNDNDKLLQSASALAEYDPNNDEEWSKISDRVADRLVRENALHAAVWMELLKPAKEHLIRPLGKFLRHDSHGRSQTQIDLATNVLEDYAAGDHDNLPELLFEAQPTPFLGLFDEFALLQDDAIARIKSELDKQPPVGSDDLNAADFKILNDEKESLSRRQANAAVAAIRLGQQDRVWPLLEHSSDNRLRSRIVNRLSLLGGDMTPLIRQFTEEENVSIRRALILMIGTFEKPGGAELTSLSQEFFRLYETDPDAGIHGATRWVLQKWGMLKQLNEIDDMLAGKPREDRQWLVTKNNRHTMTVIEKPLDGPIEFQMGSPVGERSREEAAEGLHQVRINRSFAVATTEVTVDQFAEFSRDTGIEIGYSIYADGAQRPQVSVTWFEAAQYCRWLSDKEGIPIGQRCYPEIKDIKEGMILPKNFLEQTGYRLPTEAEWEFACRANTLTSRFFGETDDLLDQYSFYSQSSNHQTWPVGQLKPSDLGLFDMHGNVFEWIQQIYFPYDLEGIYEDELKTFTVIEKEERMLRGGSFDYPSKYHRSADRNLDLPAKRDAPNGFRLFKTIK